VIKKRRKGKIKTTNGWDERNTWIYQRGKDHLFDHDGLFILFYILYFIKNNVKGKIPAAFFATRKWN